MLKFFFWLLLLANAVIFAYQRGYLESVLPSGREPGRMARQLNADQLKLIPAPGPAAESALPEATPAAPETGPAAPAHPATPAVQPGAAAASASKLAATTPAPQRAPLLACTEVGNFSNDDAKRFGVQLAGLRLGNRLSQRTVPEAMTHIVYIPPQGDKDGAEKKAAELRRLGITDFFIIQDDPALRWGISLGIFKQEEAARAHLLSLNQKGVHSARIGQRGVSGTLVAFQVRGLDANARNALLKIAAGFPKQSVRNCAAP